MLLRDKKTGKGKARRWIANSCRRFAEKQLSGPYFRCLATMNGPNTIYCTKGKSMNLKEIKSSHKTNLLSVSTVDSALILLDCYLATATITANYSLASNERPSSQPRDKRRRKTKENKTKSPEELPQIVQNFPTDCSLFTSLVKIQQW